MLFIILSVTAIAVFIFYITKNNSYWQSKNVAHDPPWPLFGNNFDVLMGRRSITQVSNEIYRKHSNEKVFGYYKGMIPELYIHDPEIIRHILNVDFSHFYNRGVANNTKIDPLQLHLFAIEGDIWKLVRQRLTPAFTSSKLKNMFPLIVNCAEKLQTNIKKDIENGKDVVDVRDLLARFATEFIGACGFGIDMDTINDEKSLYRDFGKTIFDVRFIDVLKLGLYDAFPPIRNFIRTTKKEVEETMNMIVRNICKQRNYKPSGRHDFIDLLLELESATMKGESLSKFDENGKPEIVQYEFDEKLAVAQCFVFFAAGFETSSSTGSYALHQLAYHPEIQKRVQEEIDKVLSKYQNKLCYDAINEMNFLNMTVKETLRMLSPVGVLQRECTKKYTFPDLNLTIDPGVKIAIPIQAIQMDEKYFDNPEEFRPERFSPEEIRKMHKYVYNPFGQGPRNCIGSRLGEMQTMAGLAAFLHMFSVEPAECSRYRPEVNPKSFVQSFKHGLPLRIKAR